MTTFEDILLVTAVAVLILISWQLSLLHADNIIARVDRFKHWSDSIPLSVVQHLFGAALGPMPEPMHREPREDGNNNGTEGH